MLTFARFFFCVLFFFLKPFGLLSLLVVAMREDDSYLFGSSAVYAVFNG